LDITEFSDVRKEHTHTHIHIQTKYISSEFWRHAVLWQETNVLEVHAASIFRLKMEAAWTSRGMSHGSSVGID
jgi:hypothetical protein